MKTFKITNTFTNTTTTEEHESIEKVWRSIEQKIAIQAHEDIVNNGLEEDWQDYYPTEYHAHAAHALNFLHFRRQEYEVVEMEVKDNNFEKTFNALHEQLERYEEENGYDHNSPQTKLLNALNNWKSEFGV